MNPTPPRVNAINWAKCRLGPGGRSLEHPRRKEITFPKESRGGETKRLPLVGEEEEGKYYFLDKGRW